MKSNQEGVSRWSSTFSRQLLVVSTYLGPESEVSLKFRQFLPLAVCKEGAKIVVLKQLMK